MTVLLQKRHSIITFLVFPKVSHVIHLVSIIALLLFRQVNRIRDQVQEEFLPFNIFVELFDAFQDSLIHFNSSLINRQDTHMK
ncbi:hypothetical protein HMPREF0322_04925 [Desulfitobacterium hafniense DP7]|uniref:Uncharacterized protein n=1 Tax=Desulfitobacterium hafniense DP7 TaxID=537010 RepID=G9XVB3_DESHA|nr:hypothetical protein HMPREF0322_04925 [Desulfitobacterium hafniense DP7]